MADEKVVKSKWMEAVENVLDVAPEETKYIAIVVETAISDDNDVFTAGAGTCLMQGHDFNQSDVVRVINTMMEHFGITPMHLIMGKMDELHSYIKQQEQKQKPDK